MNEAKNKNDGRPASPWGIDVGYEDASGAWHETSAETERALLEAMQAAGPRPKPAGIVTLSQGRSRPLRRPAEITLEDGATVRAEHKIPADLPAGYHRLHFENQEKPVRLIVAPGKCWLKTDLKTWGWAVQLYAARSRASWGIGDFGDLEQLAVWSKSTLGAGMLLLNPLSAAMPVKPQQASPYYPSSRRFFNPLWIRVEWVADTQRDAAMSAAIERAAQAGHQLNNERLIDRDRIFDLKMQALTLLWEGFKGSESYDRFCREQGADLERYATFCTLAEQYGRGWHGWPEEYQRPDNPAVAAFGKKEQKRVGFHQWLQWIVDEQLARCAAELPLMQDLPIGVDPDGADAWAWQDIFAQGVAVGAPPDEFNTLGQNWGLPPFIPHKLREAGYEPFIQTLRAALRHGGGLRIDHVMGLFRLFWIPQGKSADKGAFVRYKADEMLSIVALESERAGAYVVGEDLGTVERSVRRKLAQANILSYRLLWFEKEHPSTYPQEALAAVTTHDLPTVAGLWTGSDLAKQHELQLVPNEESTAEIHERLTRVAGLEQTSSIEDVIEKAYALLAHAPSRLLTAALDDALAVEERPNIPATTAEKNPNWSIALPVPIEDLMQTELAQRIGAALQRKT